MEEITNAYRVTAGKSECTSPLAILTCKEQACLTRGSRANVFPATHSCVASGDILYEGCLSYHSLSKPKENAKLIFFLGGWGGSLMSLFIANNKCTTNTIKVYIKEM